MRSTPGRVHVSEQGARVVEARLGGRLASLPPRRKASRTAGRIIAWGWMWTWTSVTGQAHSDQSKKPCPVFLPSLPSATSWRSSAGGSKRRSSSDPGQVLGDAQAHVEADEVGELERPHRVAVAELHRLVDVLGARDALLDHADRLEPEDEAQAARREARRVLHDDHGLAHALADAPRRVDDRVGVVASVRTISSSFIMWTGLKKCMPTTRSGARLACRDLRDGQRGRVRREDRVSRRAAGRASRRSRCLSSRLSGTASTTRSAVRRRRRRDRRRAARTRPSACVAGGGLDLALLDALVEVRLDVGEARRRRARRPRRRATPR